MTSAGLNEDASRQAKLWDLWGASGEGLYADRDPTLITTFLSAVEPEGAILDLGAGTGRIAIPLQQQGREVTAIELSVELGRTFASLTQSLARPPKMVRADMADFTLPGPLFSLAFAARSTIFHLTTQERQLQCLRTVRRHVRVGGSLVLDCYVPDEELLASGKRVTPTIHGDDRVHLRVEIADRETQRISYREIDLVDGVSPRVLPVEQRYCWPAELDDLAKRADFELSVRYADYERTPFTDASKRHISVYRALP